MSINTPNSIDAALAAFDEYQRRTRGTCPEVRRNYARFARMFLASVFGEGPLDLAHICAGDVVRFVSDTAPRYRPSTVKLATTALRSFFRFLRASGWCTGRLDDAVPTVPHRRHASLPRHLGEIEFERFIASLDTSSPRALRDRAMVLLVARLGLRASEVTRLRLEDIDWRAATLHLLTRKTGRGAVLPLPHDVGQALVAYLRHGRPTTRARHVFVLHHLRVGEPASRQVVGDAVERALRHAGISVPVGGANLLRHSLATQMLRHRATLKEIADVFGHRSLSTTTIYAKVDLTALREVALPWPEVVS